MDKPILMVPMTIDQVVYFTEEHGGYTGGRCFLCDEGGWLVEHRYGLPFDGVGIYPNTLHHKETCDVNNYLTKEGQLKKDIDHG